MAILPRYQSSGIAVGTPQGQFRDVSAPFDQLSAQMNKMTEFYLQEAKVQAVAEGEKYGAEKAPTVEQLKLAAATGQKIEPIGDSTTYFGRSAQKAAGEVVSTNMHYAAITELNVIKDQIDSGQLNSKDGLGKINSVISGFSDAMSDFDPVYARKFQAEMSFRGNQIYLAASKAEASAAAKQAKDNAEQLLQLEMNGIGQLIQTGDSIVTDEKGNQVPLTINEKREIKRNNLIRQASKLGGASLVKTISEKFDQKWTDQVRSTISFWATDPEANGLDRIKQIRSGNVTDPTVKSLWNSLDIVERDKTMNTVIDRVNAVNNLAKQEINNGKAELALKIKGAEDNFYFAYANNDTIGMQSNIDALASLDPKKSVKLTKMLKADAKAVDDPDIVKIFDRDEVDGKLTFDRVQSALNDGQIRGATARAYIGRIAKSEKEEVKAAIQFAKDDKRLGLYGIAPEMGRQKLGALRQELLATINSNPETDPMEFVKNWLDKGGKNIEASYTDDSKTLLRSFATERGVRARNGKYNISDIDRAIAQLSQETSDQDRIQKLINALNSLRATSVKEFE